jgi:hypothetical protein
MTLKTTTKSGQDSDSPGIGGSFGVEYAPLYQGISYGTILTEVVTHHLLLLDWSRFPESIDDGATS